MNKVKVTVVAISLGLLSTVNANVGIPNNLQWPIDNKTVKDITFFFGVDDSVLVNSNPNLLKCGNNGYKQHLGIDIKADVNTPVKAIADGNIVGSITDSNGWGRITCYQT